MSVDTEKLIQQIKVVGENSDYGYYNIGATFDRIYKEYNDGENNATLDEILGDWVTSNYADNTVAEEISSLNTSKISYDNIVNNLNDSNSEDTKSVLSAYQGYLLDQRIDELDSLVGGYDIVKTDTATTDYDTLTKSGDYYLSATKLPYVSGGAPAESGDCYLQVRTSKTEDKCLQILRDLRSATAADYSTTSWFGNEWIRYGELSNSVWNWSVWKMTTKGNDDYTGAVHSNQLNLFLDCVNGDDENLGTTFSKPFKTLDRVLQLLNEGWDKIVCYIIYPGTYQTNIKYINNKDITFVACVNKVNLSFLNGLNSTNSCWNLQTKISRSITDNQATSIDNLYYPMDDTEDFLPTSIEVNQNIMKIVLNNNSATFDNCNLYFNGIYFYQGDFKQNGGSIDAHFLAAQYFTFKNVNGILERSYASRKTAGIGEAAYYFYQSNINLDKSFNTAALSTTLSSGTNTIIYASNSKVILDTEDSINKKKTPYWGDGQKYTYLIKASNSNIILDKTAGNDYIKAYVSNPTVAMMESIKHNMIDGKYEDAYSELKNTDFSLS